MSAWYRNNEGEVIPLSNSDNIAFTFLPNRDECKTLNIKFPPKVINKTPVYSDLKTKTPIDYEFTVMHYVYSSWKFTEEYLNLLTNAIVNYTTSGKFYDPLANTSAKAVLFNDTSNKKPQKIKQNTSEIKTENKQYNKNRNMKQTIKLRESELKRVIAESVKRAINEAWDIDDNGVIDYDEFGRAKNRSYADVRGLGRGLASDTKELLRHTPHRDIRAETNYQYRLDEPNGREFSDDSGKWLRPSDWFVRGSDGWDNDEFKDFDKQTSQQPKADKSFNRALDAADKRPLHRKGSLNRAMGEAIDRIVSESIRRNLR